MRIAFCHHLSMSYNGGGEQEVGEVATELARRGHDVRVYALPFTLRKRRVVAPEVLLHDVPYEESWIHDVDCDVAYFTYSPFCLANFRVRAPRVAGFHSQVWFRRPAFSYGVVPLVAKMAYDLVGGLELRRFDAIHVHDAYLESAFSSTARPVFRIPHPVDLHNLSPPVEKNQEFTVLFCGRPEWAKGFDEFLTLAQELHDENIRFVWLGGDSRYPHVTSLGFTQDHRRVAEVMGAAHIMVMPQRVDTVGRSTLEALAMGTPVLLRASPESVPQLPSLILVQTREEFKERIRNLKASWENGHYPDTYGPRGSFPDSFSLETVADAYEEMFASVS